MYKHLSILLAAILLLTVVQSNAQTFPYLHLGEDDGLPSNNIYSVYRDSKGFMWIATDKGLARFDGMRYETFSTSNGLPHNDVFNIREDKWGRLWFGNFKGELCYYKDGKFHTPANTPWLRLDLKNVQIFSHINISRDGSLSQSSYDGSYFLSIYGEHLQLFNLGDFKSEFVSGIEPFYLPMGLGSNRFRLYGRAGYTDIDSTLHILKEQRYSFGPPSSFVFGSNGEYCITPRGEIFTLDGTLLLVIKNYNSYTPRPLEMTLYLKDPGTILTGNDAGVTLNDSIPLLKGLIVTCIVSDTAGNYWVSTRGKGIYILSKHLLQLRKYSSYPGKIVTAKVVNGTLFLVNNEGNIYTLTDGRMNLRYSAKSDTLNQAVLTRHNFLFANDGTLLQLFERRAMLFSGITKPGMLAPRAVILPEKLGTIKEQILLNDRIYLFNISSLRQIDYSALVQQGTLRSRFLIASMSDRSNRIFSKTLDPKDGAIWISRSDGIFQVKDEQLIPQTGFRNIVFNQIAISGQYFFGISDANKLVIVNDYKGNVVMDSAKDHDCIWEAIYPIDENHAIISTNNYYRLITFHKAALHATPRYAIQIIEDRLIPQRAEYIVAGPDYCYFFKDGNITRIATKVLMQKSAVPIPTFLSLKTNKGTQPIIPETSISYAESRNITLHFSNISFEGKELTCEYSISGDNTDNWTVTTGNEINLNTPGFGTYTIKIRARTLSSGYSQPTMLRLTIQRPFWATWWFVTLALLVLVVIVWGIILIATRYRLHKKQREHDTEMKFQQLEYKALNALMNPHFIFNSLNNIQGLINKDEKRTANEYLVIFSDLIRQNMHNISKGFITLQQELNLIENYLTLEKLRFKELVNYKMQIEEDVETEDIMIPPLMVQPLVENAVKHGLLPRLSSESLVCIHVFEKDNLLYIEITDNGIGLSQSLQSKNRLHESFGLVNLKKRTDHLKKIQQQDINIEVTEIRDETGHIKGTRALIVMQLIEN